MSNSSLTIRLTRGGEATTIAAVIGILGLLLNLAPIHAGFGLELLFGGAFVFLAIRLLDGGSALIVASVSSSATILLWSHPWTFFLLVGETIFLLWVRRRFRVDPLVAVPIYWILFGLPQGLLYYLVIMDVSNTVAFAIIAKLALNSLANAALGSLVASVLVIRWARLRSTHSLSFRRVILELLVIFTVLPVMIYSAFSAEDFQDERNASSAERVDRSARNASLRADALITDIAREAEYISRLLLSIEGEAASSFAIGDIQLPTAVSGIMLATADGVLIASIGRSDRDLLERISTDSAQQLQLIYAAAGDVLSPALFLPLTDAEDRIEALCIVVIDSNRLSQYVLPAQAIPNISVSLVTADGRVIVSMPDIARPASSEGLTREATDGLGFVTASHPLVLQGWEAVAQYDVGTYQRTYQLRLAQFLGSIFAIAAAAVFASAAVSKLVTAPLERLSRSIEASPVEVTHPVFQPAGLKEADALARALETASVRNSRYTAENRILARRLRSLVTYAPVMLYAAEEDRGQFVLRYVSPGLQEKLGLRLEPGSRYDLVHQHVVDSDQARISQERQRLFECGRFNAEYRIELPREGETWVSEIAVLVDDAPDGPREIVGVFIDVTARRVADNRMQQNAKLVTLGEMATGLAHELNQPLNVIRMAAQNARRALRKNGESGHNRALEKLDRIDAQIVRAANLMDHMQIFGRRPDDRFALFDLGSAVAGAVSIVAPQLRVEGVDVHLELVPSPVIVTGSMQRLEHGIMNIVLNARDAIVERRSRSGLPNGFVKVAMTTSGGFAAIEIADDGGGIEPKVLDRIFEPFVTTKPAGKGTGLGLSLVYGVVVEMGGEISVRNSERGAVFNIVLPLAEQFEDLLSPFP